MILLILISCLVSLVACFFVGKDTGFFKRTQKLLVPFAAGSLLAVVFTDLLPEAIEINPHKIHNIFYAVLLGFVAFFLLEILMHNFHHHPENESLNSNENHAANLVIIGGILHTIIDGIVIGLAFLADQHVGVVTLLAISAHKIPQEIGNFAILLKDKSRKKSMIYISLISFSAIFGGIFAYLIGEKLTEFLPELLGLTSGFFLYVSGSDIIPSINKSKNRLSQILSFIFGLIFVGVLIIFLHSGAH